jgi:hypothetical protein
MKPSAFLIHAARNCLPTPHIAWATLEAQRRRRMFAQSLCLIVPADEAESATLMVKAKNSAISRLSSLILFWMKQASFSQNKRDRKFLAWTVLPAYRGKTQALA